MMDRIGEHGDTEREQIAEWLSGIIVGKYKHEPRLMVGLPALSHALKRLIAMEQALEIALVAFGNSLRKSGVIPSDSNAKPKEGPNG